MSEETIGLNRRLRALELQVSSIPGLVGPGSLAADATNGCSNGSCTNACTNCVAEEMMNVLLPGEDRPLSGREIVKMLAIARENM